MHAANASRRSNTRQHPAAPMLSPFPYLDALRADVRQVAATLHRHSRLTRVVLVFEDGTKIPIPVMVTIEAPERDASDLPSLSALQRRILVSLRDDGPATGSVLAERLGYSTSGSLFNKGKRGLRQLMEQGLVLNDESTGYDFTDFGRDVADRLGEE
jgi:hypothetical protein